MPTSSQAMIGRPCQTSQEKKVHYPSVQAIWRPTGFKPGPIKTSRDKKGKFHCDSDKCELVKLDFSSRCRTPQQLSVNGFAGILFYDDHKRSYRWRVREIGTRKKAGESKMEGGDGINNNPSCFPNEKLDEDLKNAMESISFVSEEPSDVQLTKHFTSPAPSLFDTAKAYVSDPSQLSLQGACPILPPFNPCESGEAQETGTSCLEELAFRGRFAYTADGSLVRINENEGDDTKSRASKAHTANSIVQRRARKIQAVPKLTISNLDPMKVVGALRVPYKQQGFMTSPKARIDSFRKRKNSLPVKKRGLIEEVKDSVNWDKRVNPSIICRQEEVSPMPTAICFSLRESHGFSHFDVKNLLENQIRCRALCIQYDPVSVRTGEAEMFDRWIITLASVREREQLEKLGLIVNNDHVIVRAWDDVVREEIEAYRNLVAYPCSFRLPKQRQNIALQTFLAAH